MHKVTKKCGIQANYTEIFVILCSVNQFVSTLKINSLSHKLLRVAMTHCKSLLGSVWQCVDL